MHLFYLDGTTIGTTTDPNGYFELEVNSSQNASLIISFISYETQIYSLSEFINSEKIYLKESNDQLKRGSIKFRYME